MVSGQSDDEDDDGDKGWIGGRREMFVSRCLCRGRERVGAVKEEEEEKLGLTGEKKDEVDGLKQVGGEARRLGSQIG